MKMRRKWAKSKPHFSVFSFPYSLIPLEFHTKSCARFDVLNARKTILAQTGYLEALESTIKHLCHKSAPVNGLMFVNPKLI